MIWFFNKNLLLIKAKLTAQLGAADFASQRNRSKNLHANFSHLHTEEFASKTSSRKVSCCETMLFPKREIVSLTEQNQVFLDSKWNQTRTEKFK